MKYILGVSALYHDSAAALVSEGEIIAAAQEERFTRKKNDLSIPVNAIRYVLKEGGVKPEELETVVYYDDPMLTLDRFEKNVMMLGEKSDALIERSMQSLVGAKLWIHESLKHELGTLGRYGKLLTVQHHYSHAAAAFYPSPFSEAVIITIDGVGEWDTTTVGVGCGEKIKLFKSIRYPHSIGLLYSAFTYFCGFKVNSGEYKLMGLAPYGEPVYYELIKDKLVTTYSDGSFRLNLAYFSYYYGNVTTNEKFDKLFGGPRREPESRITKRELDIAASIQKVTEEMILTIVKNAKEEYGEGIDNLVLAGGVALNCSANGKIADSGIFKNIWIQPAAGDAGSAIGCALYAWYNKYNGVRKVSEIDSQKGSFLGCSFSNSEIKAYLDTVHAPYHASEEDSLFETIAGLLEKEKVIGLMQGRMEFGPRALGGRSIIADARSERMQSRLNLKIKKRESFRPFAPAVLEERMEDYFNIKASSPYMLFVEQIAEDKKLKNNSKSESGDWDLIEIINEKRSDIPAVTHVDYSARVQTVDRERNPYFYKVLKAFEEKTGCAVLVNTSFNVRGEPIVRTPQDAYSCFMNTDMDVLVMENCILYKEEQGEYQGEKIDFEQD